MNFTSIGPTLRRDVIYQSTLVMKDGKFQEDIINLGLIITSKDQYDIIKNGLTAGAISGAKLIVSDGWA